MRKHTHLGDTSNLTESKMRLEVASEWPTRGGHHGAGLQAGSSIIIHHHDDHESLRQTYFGRALISPCQTPQPLDLELCGAGM